MLPATRAWIAASALAIAAEHAIDRTLVQQTKTAIRRLATERGIDLVQERISLWRPHGPQDFEHLASIRFMYQAFQLAETLGEDLFLFNAPAGDVLPLLAAALREGK